MAMVFALLFAAVVGGEALPPITYIVRYPGTSAGRLRVEIELPPLPAPRVLVIPRAIPMGYAQESYDRFVSSVEAFGSDGKKLAVERVDGPRWLIRGPGEIRRVAYEVDLARMEKETPAADAASKAREGYVGLLGYSVFGFLEGLENRRCRLEVRAPGDWPVFSTLAPSDPPPAGTVSADASDFYALADSQIAMGPRVAVRREKARVPFFIVTYDEGRLDVESTARLAGEALDAMIEYFGGAPFPRYTVLFESLRPIDADHSYGFSMEHLESSTYFLDIARALGPDATPREVSRALYNFAHHIAHAWIPKRSYGTGYFPFTWELAPVIDTIWLSEGFAQYAAADAVADKRPDGEAYRKALLDFRFRQTLAEAPGFLRRMSTIELSRIASTQYTRDFRTGSNSFARGGLMAAEMDEAIRKRTGGRRRFRDALRHLVAWSAKERRAFRIDELPRILRAGAGVDVRAILEKWLRPQEHPLGREGPNGK
jgi:predicted metalloprotease with PDZ domain